MLCRQGEVSAEALQQQFALAFQSQAPSLFLELAELLPSPQQRTQLLTAASRAGWALPDEAAVDGAPREPDQENTGSWQPLDRSRVQAAASALAEKQVLVPVLSQFPDMGHADARAHGGSSTRNGRYMYAGLDYPGEGLDMTLTVCCPRWTLLALHQPQRKGSLGCRAQAVPAWSCRREYSMGSLGQPSAPGGAKLPWDDCRRCTDTVAKMLLYRHP